MNPTLSARDITLELLAIQEHIKKKPTFESGNLLVVAGWHAVAELLHVSRWLKPWVFCRILTALNSTISYTGRRPAHNGSSPSTSMQWPSTSGRPRTGLPTVR